MLGIPENDIMMWSCHLVPRIEASFRGFIGRLILYKESRAAHYHGVVRAIQTHILLPRNTIYP